MQQQNVSKSPLQTRLSARNGCLEVVWQCLHCLLPAPSPLRPLFGQSNAIYVVELEVSALAQGTPFLHAMAIQKCVKESK